MVPEWYCLASVFRVRMVVRWFIFQFLKNTCGKFVYIFLYYFRFNLVTSQLNTDVRHATMVDFRRDGQHRTLRIQLVVIAQDSFQVYVIHTDKMLHGIGCWSWSSLARAAYIADNADSNISCTASGDGHSPNTLGSGRTRMRVMRPPLTSAIIFAFNSKVGLALLHIVCNGQWFWEYHHIALYRYGDTFAVLRYPKCNGFGYH